MDIYCTRPHCEQPLNSFSDLDDSKLLKTVHQRHCSNCGMPLILDGRYLPIRLLQQGGLGVAFIGCDRRTPGLKRCVIKQLQINPSFNTAQLEIATKLFHREAEVLEKLGEHPRIPRLFAFLELTASAAPPYTQQKFFYLVQEYVQGQNLQEELQAKGKFSEAEVMFVLRETAKILEFIHIQGTIHRDIKPSNIMRDPQGQIYLIDFGAVKQIVAETTIATTPTPRNVTCVFTPEYAPWEQRQGQAIYPSSDLYALAVTCLNLLTGRQPQDLLDIDTNNWRWRTPDLQVSDAFAQILDKMLQNLPKERFQSARDVLDALDATWGQPTVSLSPSKIMAANTAASTTMLSVALDNNLPEIDVDPEPPVLVNRDPQLHVNNSPPPPDRYYPPEVAVVQPPIHKQKPWILGGILAGILGLSTIGFASWKLLSTRGFSTIDPIASRSSMGEQILLSIEGNKDNFKFKELKKAGVLAIANRNYAEATAKLQAALVENPNSPETRIYLNNALIGDKKSYTIAVSVPISSRSLNRASEMLRGFAQAQEEMNQAGNVNEAKIKLKIIDDGDDPKLIESIATELAKKPEVLGVVGNNRNDVTMKAAAIYNERKLAFIAPISTANQLTGNDKPYIFRTNATADSIAQKLVDYSIDKDRKRKFAIFYVPTITYNDEFKTQFASKLVSRGGEVVGSFPFSTTSSSASPTTTSTVSTFDAEASLQKAKALGAESILLLPVGRSSREALKILKLRASKYPQMSVFGDTALYSVSTLEEGKSAAGLIMGVPWQESQSTPQFSTSARQLWNNQVNWATATSYNAVRAMGTAIKAQESPSRESVMKILSTSEFLGASRRFKFTNGEPTEQYVLVKVSVTPPNSKYSSRTGFDFVPLE
jgi:ABC-type branched-subunit amino acid transport system substrate-binding protein/serine/threonine protein kinase